MSLEAVFFDDLSECLDVFGAATSRTMSMTSLLPLFGLVLLLVGPTLVVGQGGRRQPGVVLKDYSGLRARSDSHRQVYYFDQTIAVVELGPGKQLENCELIEVYSDVQKALQMKNFSSISRPIDISFGDMNDLMLKCQLLEAPASNTVSGRALTTDPDTDADRSMQMVSPLSLFSGILPGTKWCGTGDIASTYFDLGETSDIDKCCRTHDLCPSKVRAFTSRYNLTNYSVYTKSHCNCDSMFYNCLKATKNPTANVMGNVYFNIVRVPCLEDVGCDGTDCVRHKQFKAARKHF